jgi:gliding motility-associated-like protein
MTYSFGNNCKDTLPLAMIEEIAFIDNKIDDAHFEVQAGDTITIDLSSMYVEGEYKIEWELINAWNCIKKDNQDNCIKANVICQEDETYYVDIYNSDGCIENIEGTIRIKEENQIILLPNVFDASIETFKPYSTQPFYINEMKIYDRWGNLMYKINGVPSNEFKGWDGSFDGSKVNLGVYVYTLEVVSIDGEFRRFLGDVTLVR